MDEGKLETAPSYTSQYTRDRVIQDIALDRETLDIINAMKFGQVR
jgi:hypothetical protein